MTAPLAAPLSASVRGSGAPEGVRGVRGDSVNFRPLWGYARSVSPMPWGAWPEERAMQAAVGARSARIVGVVLVFLATGLASFSDAQSHRPVGYDYQYMPSGGGGCQPYDPNNPPSNVGTTTTDQGKTVPYIVRRESGSQDRGQYQIAVLFDPTKSWAPWAPQAGWNGKTYVTGGPGCRTHHGSPIAPAVM